MEALETILASRGHMDMAHDGRRLVAEGITTTEEIHRVVGKCDM